MPRTRVMVFLFSLIITLPACVRDINLDLLVAAKKGDTATVQALLDKGADVNAKDKDGWTALMFAANNGHATIVQALLDRGADVNAKTEDEKGATALMVTAWQGHTAIVEALLDRGADVNAKAKDDGMTALMLAVMEGHTATVQALLDKGADVNAKDKSGLTALMLAKSEGHTEIVVKLLIVKSFKKAGAKRLSKPEPEPVVIDISALKARLADHNEPAYLRIKLLEQSVGKGQDQVVNDAIRTIARRHAKKVGSWTMRVPSMMDHDWESQLAVYRTIPFEFSRRRAGIAGFPFPLLACDVRASGNIGRSRHALRCGSGDLRFPCHS